jgi:sugar O-acyltransferase (sialic acid O-acetyltransferase NeuD family)
MKTVIFGNGAMARVVFSYVRHGMDVAGFTVDDAFCGSAEFCGRRLVPFSAVAEVFDPAAHVMLTAIGYTDMNMLRAGKYQAALALGYRFTRYAHPSVMAHDGVTLADNTVILDHVSIHCGCHIGCGTFISSNVNVGHDCDIGAFSWINSGVAIAGGCRVGAGSVFGVNAAVADGVTIGQRSFIGAGSLVHRPTADDSVLLGEAGSLLRLRSAAFLQFARRRKEGLLF